MYDKELTAEDFYEQAKKALEDKDLTGFIENIGCASLLAREKPELFSEIIFYKARGLYILREFEKAQEAIETALKNNEGINKFKLLNYQGLILTYQGSFSEAIKLYENILEQNKNNTQMKIKILINIVFTYLVWYRVNRDNSTYLKQAYRYLKMLNEYFEEANNYNKLRICLNLAEYYYFIADYKKAIALLTDSQKYSKKEELPFTYNSLAEIYLEMKDYTKVEEYLNEAEKLAEKYQLDLELGKVFYTRAILVAIAHEDLIRVVNLLSVAMDNFISAGALSYAYDCFARIMEYSQKFNKLCLEAFKKAFKGNFKDSPLFRQL